MKIIYILACRYYNGREDTIESSAKNGMIGLTTAGKGGVMVNIYDAF